jgi:uncharacterized repeat protein (TIGR03943 family)
MASRILTLITLLVWSGFLLWFRFSGRVEAYLHPQFHAYVAAAGIGLLALAGLWWWATREGDDDCGCADDHGHDHDHDHGTPRGLSVAALVGFVVLLVPVSVASVVSPSEFGEAAVMNRGIIKDVSQLPSARPPKPSTWEDAPLLGDDELPDIDSMPPEDEGVEFFTRGPDGAILLETIDLMFAAQEPALREEFEGQRVAVIGQFVTPREGGEGGFQLVRMFVVCCAADARPTGVDVTGASGVEGIPGMGWVRVTGKAVFEEKEGRFEPKIEAENVEKVEAPRETFVY